MDISKLTDQEKSVLLAKAMGWTLVFPSDWNDYDKPFADIVDNKGEEIDVIYATPSKQWGDFTLYNQSNMALAKRVIVWGFENDNAFNEWLSDKTTALEVLIQDGGIRRALDYLVESPAIETGIIEEE